MPVLSNQPSPFPSDGDHEFDRSKMRINLPPELGNQHEALKLIAMKGTDLKRLQPDTEISIIQDEEDIKVLKFNFKLARGEQLEVDGKLKRLNEEVDFVEMRQEKEDLADAVCVLEERMEDHAVSVVLNDSETESIEDQVKAVRMLIR